MERFPYAIYYRVLPDHLFILGSSTTAVTLTTGVIGSSTEPWPNPRGAGSFLRRMPRSKLFRVFRTLVLTYVVALVLAAVFQRSLIYHPSRAAEAVLVEEARALGLEPWRDAAGATIGWKSPARAEGSARNRWLFSMAMPGTRCTGRRTLRASSSSRRGACGRSICSSIPAMARDRARRAKRRSSTRAWRCSRRSRARTSGPFFCSANRSAPDRRAPSRAASPRASAG